MRKKRSKEEGSKSADIVRLVDNGGWGLHRNRGKEVMQNPALFLQSMRSEHIPNMVGSAIKIQFQGSRKTKDQEGGWEGEKKKQKTVSEMHTKQAHFTCKKKKIHPHQNMQEGVLMHHSMQLSMRIFKYKSFWRERAETLPVGTMRLGGANPLQRA